MEDTVVIEQEIQRIFNENKLTDLKKFIEKRGCLNNTNLVLSYGFHVVQSAGVLITTIAAGYNVKELIWVGVGMNILASLMDVFQKLNTSVSKKLYKDIEAIRNGTYVDEGMMVEGGEKFAQKETASKTKGSVNNDEENQHETSSVCDTAILSKKQTTQKTFASAQKAATILHPDNV